MVLLAPLYSTRTKSKLSNGTATSVPFFWRKNCTVPSGGKFSPVFPVKRKALKTFLHNHVPGSLSPSHQEREKRRRGAGERETLGTRLLLPVESS